MQFQPLASLAELADGYRKTFVVGGCTLLLIQDQGRRFLVDAHCPHMGSRLDSGEVVDGRIRCPHHLYLFDLQSGACMTPGTPCDPLRQLPVVTQGDWVGLDLNLLADWL